MLEKFWIIIQISKETEQNTHQRNIPFSNQQDSIFLGRFIFSYYIERFRSDHCRSLVFEYIETFYNTKRIHSHCGFTSPNEYEAKFQYRKICKV
ncbi:MAG: IS3 family transposase [Treponema sp.]|nr:IS3 family transposase [Candidatus Treponema caballi]